MKEVKYLGEMISSHVRMEKEVEASIASATRMVGRMSEMVLRRKEQCKHLGFQTKADRGAIQSANWHNRLSNDLRASHSGRYKLSD